MVKRLRLAVAVLVLVSLPGRGSVRAQTDLDAFMRQVLEKRDDNWKKLQQYVLDEHETIELRGPTRLPMWGEKRDYTWYIRDGFFVRSPVRANGVAIGEEERRKYEADYLKRQQRREQQAQGGQVALSPSGPVVDLPDDTPAVVPDREVDGILKQTRRPQFISTAYFLRFKFEEGNYALVGRETIDSHETLKIEYYPEKMFSGTDRRRTGREPSDKEKARDAEFRRLMNKVALVTVWVEPSAHQIVKYTFDNIALDFLPGQWLVHVDDLEASMTMAQPFADLKDVWLPRSLEAKAALTMAMGQIDLRYALDYTDYRRPDVTSKVGVKER
jgi:hypothetical protein